MPYDYKYHRERADNLGFSLVLGLAAFLIVISIGIAVSHDDISHQGIKTASPAIPTSTMTPGRGTFAGTRL
jgi:hypothetical protein